MALTPGTRCPCDCGCAVPAALNARGCPCSKCGGCNSCNSRVRASGESARTVPAGRVPVSESRTPATPAAAPPGDARFQALLHTVRSAGATAARPAAPQPPSAEESAPLHTLSTDELGRRLVRALAENHASPWWAPVRENAGPPAQAAPAGLAEQVQALPDRLQAMSLTEAMASRYDLHSPAWTRGTRSVRTIFVA